jgi:hypothetical protein
MAIPAAKSLILISCPSQQAPTILVADQRTTAIATVVCEEML